MFNASDDGSAGAGRGSVSGPRSGRTQARARTGRGQWNGTDHEGQALKSYDIELQKLRSMRHDKGLIEVSMDALVMPRKMHEDDAGSTCLRIPVDHARTLMLLLKQQFAELDKLQPRSRRSGRA